MRYIDRCTYTEEYKDGQQVYIFTGPCMVTGKPYSIRVPGPGLYAYNQGKDLSECFPEMSMGDREFMISGTSPEGWKQLFGDEE